MDNYSNFLEIRCNADREHTIKGTPYKKCGSLIGATNKEEKLDFIHICQVCGKWTRIRKDADSEIINFEILKKQRFNFIQPLRTGR